jgi:hypothetical protein
MLDRSRSRSRPTVCEARTRTFLQFVAIAACLTSAQRPAFAQEKPKLLEINGFMFKGVFTELDAEQMKRRLSLADLEKSHFNGKATEIEKILGFMAKSEKMRSRVDEPLEVRGEIPVTLPPNSMGNEAYTACFYAFTLNGLVLGGSGDELILIRPETRRNLPRPERPWNRERVLPIQLFRLGYLKSDPILAQYRDKLGTKAGRAILDVRSNVVIVADTAASLEKLQRYIDAEAVEAMGVSAVAGHAPGDALRPPSLGAIAARENIHFYLMTFARMSQIPMSGSEEQGVSDKYYPEADLWIGARGYRVLESEYKRINEFVQHARQTGGEEWPVPDGERTLSLARQKKLSIHFGVVTPEPGQPKPAKTKKPARRR